MKKFLAGLALALSMVSVPSFALAQTSVFDAAQQNLDASGGSLGGTAGTSRRTLPQIVNSVIDVVLGLMGILLMVYFVYGGFLWMTAGGDSKKVDESKAIIKNATIGLGIILASYVIASFVLGALVTATTGQTVQ